LSGYTFIGAFGGHTYFASNDLTDWGTAKAAAEGLGAHLVSISNAAENAFVQTIIPSVTFLTAWIGLSDAAMEGDYVWIDGTPYTYSNWSGGEPNNAGDEDYVHMYSDGTWNDLAPSSNYIYIIEFDESAPVLPSVLDVCGAPITPGEPVIGGTFDGCEGTKIYTYTYTDCAGLETQWAYIYFIVREDFDVPEGDGSTVSCPNDIDITDINVPVVLSDCGEQLFAIGPVNNANLTDTYNGCQGTSSYTWTYIDCAGHHHDWTYVYTVVRNDFSIPETLDHSTVECIGNAAATSVTLPVVYSDCDELLTPTGQKSMLQELIPMMVAKERLAYTWHYQDCINHNHTWTYTFTVEHITPTC
jgi:hypothetical protein